MRKRIWLIAVALIFIHIITWANNKEILLTETEEIKVAFTNILSTHETAFIKEQIGVGMLSAIQSDFNAVIIDEIPSKSGEVLLNKTKGNLNFEDLHKKKMVIPYQIKTSKDKKVITFTLSEIPTVTSAAGDCCSCDGSCAGACGIEYYYYWQGPVDTGKWADMKLEMNTAKFQIKHWNKAKLIIYVTNISLKKAKLELFLSNQIDGMKISLPESPEGFEVDLKGNGMLLSRNIGEGLQKFIVPVEIYPLTKQPWRIPELVKLTGSLGKPVLAPATCMDHPVAKHEYVVSVNFVGDWVGK